MEMYLVYTQWKYCWYLDLFIILGLLAVKSYVSFFFWKKKWQGFNIYIVFFPNFEIIASSN